MNSKDILPPCTYQGGKQRLSKQIVDIFYKENTIDDNTKFYDLCCGSGAITIELINREINPKNIYMVDKSIWGLVYNLIGNEEFDLSCFKSFINTIPKDITKIKDFAQSIINNNVDKNMIPYHFLFLQACSFGGTATWIENNKWCKSGGLRNYWLPTENSNRKSPVNPMMPMPDSLYQRVEKLAQKLKNVNAYCMDIFEVLYMLDEEIENNNNNIIIYIDPPYQNTCKYGYDFDIYELERRIWNNVPIYISESKQLEGAKKSFLLSKGRNKGNINGKINKKPIEEWLNKY